MSQILHNHDFKWNRIYAKKNVNFFIFKLQQIGVISKLYTKTQNFIKIPYEYLVSTLLKLKKIPFVLHFFELLQKKSVKIWREKRIYNKTLYVWSNKFTAASTILHNCWFWWLRHLEGQLSNYFYTKLLLLVQLSWRVASATRTRF